MTLNALAGLPSRVGHDDKIIITGAAGLVGQNLVVQLRAAGYRQLVAIDKHAHNLNVLQTLHPDVTTLCADVAEPGDWQQTLDGAACLIQLQAQITGTDPQEFVRNNITATQVILAAAQQWQLPYLVHISSSVVNSVADDDYTRTKRAQEQLVVASGVRHCVLRPTLMFGWFDPKHLGWLSRFMERTPVFPIPGHGRYMRQPLYNKDFCRIIIRCMEAQPAGTIYDVVGQENVDYVDIIHAIKRAKQLRTPIVHIPYHLFYALLKLYAVFSKKPPFTADQLKALTAGDEFSGVDIEPTFGFRPTLFQDAITETFTDPQYAGIILQR